MECFVALAAPVVVAIECNHFDAETLAAAAAVAVAEFMSRPGVRLFSRDELRASRCSSKAAAVDDCAVFFFL